MKVLITGGSGFIGTNLVTDLLQKGIEFINIDWNAPLNPEHALFWKECDIMDLNSVQEIFSSFQPSVVIHLAARTDTDIYDLEGDLNEYIQNTEGTKNVIQCINQTSSVKRAIITSTMFVCEPGYAPASETDYKPFTLYGVSKILTEKYTRDLNCTWTIIRPQTIWGPWSMRYKNTMFRVMKKGLYFHPSKKNVQRAYGYVGNVVWQIHQILTAPKNVVHQQTFYVGDEPMNLLDWVNTVSTEFTGKPARILPTYVVKGIAITGDLLKKINISFPLTSTRFNSMTQNYLTNIRKTYTTFGTPPFTIKEGVKEFIQWYYVESDKTETVVDKKLKVTIRS
jgi:nucleoside-diphosphate-sugar epimerase